MSLTFPKDVYPTDGVQFEFEITFPFSDPSDVFAFLIHESSGAYRRLIPNLDYTISGTTLRTRVDDFRDPWPAGYMLTILRRTRITQPSSQAMTPLVLRHRIDQLTQIMQQLREQADRTLHIGTAYPPLNLTSKVYALEFRDAVGAAGGMIIRSVYDPILPFSDAVGGAGGIVVGGSMREPAVLYADWPPDEVVGAGATINSGSMRDPLVLYTNWPPDAVESAGATINSGTMIAPVVAYENWPPDAVASAGCTIISGTMTT